MLNIVHVYYMKNPVDFDKHVSELDFVQYKVRKKQLTQQSYNFFYCCSDNSQTCIWPRRSILLTAIFFNNSYFKHTSFLIPCLQWHYVVLFKLILYWCLFHFAGSIFLIWFYFLFVYFDTMRTLVGMLMRMIVCFDVTAVYIVSSDTFVKCNKLT